MTFTETISLTKIECGGCGGVFALNTHFVETKQRESGGFTCPYCAERRGWWESAASKLEKQLAAKAAELSAAKCQALKNAEALAAQLKITETAERKLKRVNNGVCPCCNRTFQNLARHMATKHAAKPVCKTITHDKTT